MAQTRSKHQKVSPWKIGKMGLLGIWLILSVAWGTATWQRTDMDAAMAAYKTFYYYENRIMSGNATDYQRQLYSKFGRRLENAGRNFTTFFLLGIALPSLILAGGTWILRTRN